MSEGVALLSQAKMALQSHRAWMEKHSTSVLATAVYAPAISTKMSFTKEETHMVSSATNQPAAEDSEPKRARKDARMKQVHSTSTTNPILSPHDADTTPPGEYQPVFFSPPRAQAWSTPTKEQTLPLQKASSADSPSPEDEEPAEMKELAVDSSISSMASDTSDARDDRGAICSSLGPGRSEVPSSDSRREDEALWSASGTKVVCVSPAPSHLRTDTTNARRSKLGTIGDIVESAAWSKDSVSDGMYRKVMASCIRDNAGGNEEMPESTKLLVISLKASEGYSGNGEEGEEGGIRNNSVDDGDGGDGDVKCTSDVKRVFGAEDNTAAYKTTRPPELGKHIGKKQDIDQAMQLLVKSAPITRGPAMMVTLPQKSQGNPSPALSTPLEEPSVRYDSSPVLKMSQDVAHSDKQSNVHDSDIDGPPAPTVQDVLCGSKILSKRARAPPPYTMHTPRVGVAVSSPSCPLYGVLQPTNQEVIKISMKPLELEGPSVVKATSPADSESVVKATSRSVVKATSRPSMENDVSFPLKPSSAQDGRSPSSDMEDEEALTPSSALSRIPACPGPLHLLARTGNLRRLQAAIEEGHDVNALDHEGKTPLMYCITDVGVHLSCADQLLKEGANLDHQSSDGSTALHVASYVGALSLIELMLLNGANPDIKDLEGRLPLHWATKPKSPKCIATLLKNSNFDINKGDDSGMTALMWACHFDNASIVSYLLDHGADLEEKDKDGLTAMHWAIHKHSVQCVQLLLKPDMTYFKDHQGLTVMHRAALEGSMVACEHILTMRGDAFHDTDKKGRTPLHYAAAGSKVDVCAFLMDRGADASQRDFSGHTPLDYAYIKKLDYVVALFMCHEASVADFARVSRSVISGSNASLELSDNRSMTHSATLFKALTEGTHPASDFLGKYSNNGKGPLRHYYFWVDFQAKAICWSRYSNMRAPEVAHVQSVQGGASDVVKMRVDYSPVNINKYSFWVATTGGVLDLIAYSEEKYVSWLTHINDIAYDKRDVRLDLMSSPQTTRPTTATRHAWSTQARMEH